MSDEQDASVLVSGKCGQYRFQSVARKHRAIAVLNIAKRLCGGGPGKENLRGKLRAARIDICAACGVFWQDG